MEDTNWVKVNRGTFFVPFQPFKDCHYNFEYYFGKTEVTEDNFFIACQQNGGGLCLLLKNNIEIPTSGAMDKVTRSRSIFSFRANGQLINSFEIIDKEDVIHIQYLDDNGHILVFYQNSQVRIYTQRGVMIKDFKLAQNLAT